MTNDVARHPLRQKLPPLTLAIDLAQDAPIKWFVISFTAFFIVFSTFLA
jgi:hypothetical protein